MEHHRLCAAAREKMNKAPAQTHLCSAGAFHFVQILFLIAVYSDFITFSKL